MNASSRSHCASELLAPHGLIASKKSFSPGPKIIDFASSPVVMESNDQPTNTTRAELERLTERVFQLSDPLDFRKPTRERELNLQGARSDPPHTRVTNRVRPTTAAAAQPGGASSSKWTRKTRPWNVSMPTAVVASFSAEAFAQAIFGGPKTLPNHPPLPRSSWAPRTGEDHSAPRCSPGLPHRGRPPSFRKEATEALLSHRAVASTAPPSRFVWAGETDA